MTYDIRVRHIAWFDFGVELSVPFSPLIFTFFTLSFFTFEVGFENCKCRSWCRPDDLVSSYTKSGTVLMYFLV